MALDEPGENDEVFNEKGVSFLIEKELFNQVKPIFIDFVHSPMGSGFMVQSELSKKGGCGSSCSC
ncbi:MAG TPA: hypothetical protein PLM71_05920 [Syntrophorhabdaceae bacterium]|nr:hypothetical protein [Syntrophorhabdaceae bacterium]HPU29842.1 hypothetical protein [Syntrophorhabdaceae bacterium]